MYVGEDVDFVWRMAAAGWRVRYEPGAVMGHDHRVTFRAWFSRRADYGTSAAALEELHPGAVRPLYASWWTAGAWAAALAGRPVTAAALTAAATALLARRLSRRHRRALAGPRPPAGTARSDVRPRLRTAAAWRLAVRLAGGGTSPRRRPPRQRPVPDLVAGRDPGGARRQAAAPAGRGPDPRAAAARLGRPEAAARPGPLRRRPPARRRRLQPRRLAGLPRPPHGPPAAPGDRRQAPARLTRVTWLATRRPGARRRRHRRGSAASALVVG